MQIKKLANERLKNSESFVLFTFNEDSGSNITMDYKTNGGLFTLMSFIKEFIKFQDKKHEEDVSNFLEQKYGNEGEDEGASKGFFG